MTLTSTITRSSFAGTGSTGPFAFPFKIFSETDLVVVKRSAVGSETVLNWPADFTVAGVGSGTGGTITLTVAPVVGETISIRRAPALTQPTSIRNQGAYFPATIEDEFDRLTMQIQGTRDLVDRAFGLSESFDPSLYGMRVSPGLAGQVIGWATPTQLGNVTLSSGAVALPGAGRTVTTLSTYLANNATSYNLRDVGIPVDGVADARTLLNTLVNVTMQALTPPGGEIDVVGTVRIASNMTFPSNVRINFMGGGTLAPDTGITVTIGGAFSTHLDKKFGGLGTIAFGDGHIPAITPQWWGVAANGVTDDTVGLKACWAAACATGVSIGGGCSIYCPNGDYVLTDTLPVTQHRIHIYGDGKWATQFVFNPASAKPAFTFQNTVTGTGTVSSAAGAATFSTTQAGRVVNGDILIIGANYYSVSAFNGTTGATLTALTGGSTTFGASAWVTSRVIYQCSVRQLTFTSSFTVQQKIAIDLYDASEFHVQEITVGPSGGWSGNSGNGATPSIGVRVKGRELFSMTNCDIFADRPVHLTRNPSSPTLSADHFHFTNMYLGATVSTESCYLIDGDVGLANLTLDGYQGWLAGQYGVRALSGSPPSQALEVNIYNGRYEQPANNTGFAIDWEIACTNLNIYGCNFGGVGSPTSGGLKARNVVHILMQGCEYTGTGGAATALDIDSTVRTIKFVQTFFQDSSVVSMPGFEELEGLAGGNSLAPIKPNSFWFLSSAGSPIVFRNGVATHKTIQTLAVAVPYNLILSGSAALKTGQVRVSCYSATGPIREMGIWHVDGTGAVKVAGTANTNVGNFAAALNVWWQAISTIGVINNLAQPVKALIETEWTT